MIVSVAVTSREWSDQFGAWVETRFRRINGNEYEFVRVTFEAPSDRVFLWVYRNGAHVREFVSGQR